MPELLALSHFTPLVGVTFRLPAVEGMSLVLTEAEALVQRKAPPGQVREPFSLIFIGPMSPLLPQQIYLMEPEGASPLEIFIVPIGPGEGGMAYQAIFN